jgi:hypothetical protein
MRDHFDNMSIACSLTTAELGHREAAFLSASGLQSLQLRNFKRVTLFVLRAIVIQFVL